jgi:hypothetical protein
LNAESADDNEWFGILQPRLQCLRSNVLSECLIGRRRQVMQLYTSTGRRFPPAGERTRFGASSGNRARSHCAASPHAAASPQLLAVSSQFGFDLDLSCLLFDGERPFGAFLTRRMREGLCIDVQVVRQTNPRLRSLGDLFMLYHDAQRVPADGPIRWIWFRSGANEHRQTANLALRMGGRELARCHLMAMALGNPVG